jgi:hypothetical protein
MLDLAEFGDQTSDRHRRWGLFLMPVKWQYIDINVYFLEAAPQ